MIGNSIGVQFRNYRASGGIDPDAQAFINAAGITGLVQINAINTLVLNMKTQGLWSKMKAVYPFVTDNRNLLGYTEDFANVYWTKENSTIAANSTTAPNGTLTADTATLSPLNGNFRVSSVSLGSNITHTISIYVKQSASNPASNIRITTNDTVAWSTGVSQRFALTSSWQRITLSGVLINSGTNVRILFGAVDVNGNPDNTCLGNVDVWGAQLELGSTATSYQPIATTQQAFISNQFKYNLVNPVDSDAAFRLVFNGGWTHSAQGATPNGTNGYADTNLVPSSVLAQNSASLSLYSRTNNTSLIDRVEMGSSNVTVDIQQAIRWNGTLGNLSRLNNGYIVGTSGYIPTKTSGLFAVSRTSSTITKKYEDGILKETTADPSATPNSFSIYLATRNNSGTAAFFDAKQYAFATIGDGLTDTEAANLYTAVQTFNQTLNRQVGAQIVSDADAQAFINRVYTAGGTLTNTEANAVNQLVIDMKAAGIWTSMRAVYPMVGSSAAACAQNLRSSSFTGTFTSGWTFASTGVTPNGTSAYMDTKLIPSTSLSLNSASIGYYSRTNSAISSEIAMGILNGFTGGNGLNLVIRRDTNLNSFRATETGGANGLVNSTSTDSRGLTSGSITSSTSRKLYKNGTLLATNSSNYTWDRASNSVMIAAAYNTSNSLVEFYTNKECAFSYISDGLSDTEAANLYTAVQTFQTTLNRQV